MGIRNLAGAMSFAHLAGLARPKAAKADDEKDRNDKPESDDKKDDKDEERDQREGESDDDYAKRMKALDDKEEKEKAESDKEKDDGKDEPDAEDDDDEEEMHGKSAAARARRRERARCAAIFASSHAAKNVALAASLAFSTSMTRKEAIAVLRDTPAPAMVDRSSRNPRLGPAGDGSAGGPVAIAKSWDAAFAKQPLLARR